MRASEFIAMYRDGFRGLGRLGKTMWLIVAIKLVVLFLIIKLLFFPDFLKSRYSTDRERAEAVRERLSNTH